MKSTTTPRYWRRVYGTRAVKEVGWSLIGFPLAVVGFSIVAYASVLSIGLAITFVGIPMLAVVLWGCRWAAHGYRVLARDLLDLSVPTPRPRPPRVGILGRLGGALSDPVNWRSWLYLIVRFPLGVTSFIVAVAAWGYAIAFLTYPAWFWLIPQRDASGHLRRGAQLGTTTYLDSPATLILTAVVGVLLVGVAPWLVHGVALAERWLVRTLLGPSRSAERMSALEATRASAVTDAATTLRRIERDLHDGTQAQLVALAMQLGMAREELAGATTATEIATAQARLDAAHSASKDALADLREVVRGIHPPALDAGLETALATLAARCPVPVKLTTALPTRPSPAIESIAYFSVAELLTNVARHSGATSASVDVRVNGHRRLVVAVSDDGKGGARIVEHSGDSGGSGLAGLRDRVATVEATILITSPPGGPTSVVIDLPLAA